jgi:hypothetical protein
VRTFTRERDREDVSLVPVPQTSSTFAIFAIFAIFAKFNPAPDSRRRFTLRRPT